LFAEEDTPANRALILIHIWKKITELSRFTIRDPVIPVDENPVQERPKGWTVDIQFHDRLPERR
jgi:hypothetical protein